MKYTYAYKTSDGVRHEAAIEAKSRDEAFELLRGQGIRPIKVVAPDGDVSRQPRRTVVMVAILLAAVVGAAAFALVLLRGGATQVAAPPPSSMLVALREKATAVEARHRAAMTLADGDLAKIAKAVSEAREEARVAFKDIMLTLASPDEQREAKRLYGELMLLVDESESSAEAAARGIGRGSRSSSL